MPRDRPSFSILLPATTLLLAMAMLSPLTALRYLELRRISAHGRAVLIHNSVGTTRIPPNQFLIASLVRAGAIASRPIQVMDLPGVAIEAAMSGIMRTWPQSWRPQALGPLFPGLFAWRGLIFPIYALPFWWFAGFGLDAAFFHRRLHWPSLLIGTTFFVLFAVLLTGLAITSGEGDAHDMAFVFYGFALWIAIWATFPFAWVRNTLQVRKMKRALTESHLPH